MKKKNARAPKDAIINVRCTTKQKALLTRAAALEGLGVSTWLMRLGLLATQTAAR